MLCVAVATPQHALTLTTDSWRGRREGRLKVSLRTGVIQESAADVEGGGRVLCVRVVGGGGGAVEMGGVVEGRGRAAPES